MVEYIGRLYSPVDRPAQHPYTGAHPVRDTADASRQRCVCAEQSSDVALGQLRHVVTCRHSHARQAVPEAWRGALASRMVRHLLRQRNNGRVHCLRCRRAL